MFRDKPRFPVTTDPGKVDPVNMLWVPIGISFKPPGVGIPVPLKLPPNIGLNVPHLGISQHESTGSGTRVQIDGKLEYALHL